MTRIINWLRRARPAAAMPQNPHIRRDIGLPEIDRTDWLMGREISQIRRWL